MDKHGSSKITHSAAAFWHWGCPGKKQARLARGEGCCQWQARTTVNPWNISQYMANHRAKSSYKLVLQTMVTRGDQDAFRGPRLQVFTSRCRPLSRQPSLSANCWSLLIGLGGDVVLPEAIAECATREPKQLLRLHLVSARQVEGLADRVIVIDDEYPVFHGPPGGRNRVRSASANGGPRRLLVGENKGSSRPSQGLCRRLLGRCLLVGKSID